MSYWSCEVEKEDESYNKGGEIEHDKVPYYSAMGFNVCNGMHQTLTLLMQLMLLADFLKILEKNTKRYLRGLLVF